MLSTSRSGRRSFIWKQSMSIIWSCKSWSVSSMLDLASCQSPLSWSLVFCTTWKSKECSEREKLFDFLLYLCVVSKTVLLFFSYWKLKLEYFIWYAELFTSNYKKSLFQLEKLSFTFLNSLYFLINLIKNGKQNDKFKRSHVIGADHHEHFFYQIAELIFWDSVITIFIDFVQNIIDFLSRGVVDTDLLSDLH